MDMRAKGSALHPEGIGKVYKNKDVALAGVAQLVGTSSYTPQVCGFNSQSGHIPRW